MGAGMEQQEKNEIRLELPEKVRQIIEQIQKHGFEAYAVGVCLAERRMTGTLPHRQSRRKSRQFFQGR